MFEIPQRIHQRYGVIFVAVLFLLGSVSTVWCAEGDYDGTYAGSFSGDDSGYWVGIIDTGSDSLYLSYSTASGEGDGGYVSWRGSAESGTVGNYYGWSVINDSYVDAFVDSSDGSVSGSWSNSSSGDSGTITGNEVTSISYAGSYSGTFSGDDSGNWSMTIASNGYVTGTISPASGGTHSFEGGCHPDGYIIVVGEDSTGVDFAVFGRVSGSSVSGEWITDDGYSGDVVSSGGSNDGDGGGGGGCFIMSLAGE
jgi:hypothetical protein